MNFNKLLKRKYVLSILIIIVGFTSCKLSNNNNEIENSSTSITLIKEIDFSVKTTDESDLEIFEDGVIPWVSIENPLSGNRSLIGGNDLVLEYQKVGMVIDYPLNKPVEFEITSKDAKGFTRKELVEIVSSKYHQIYNEEEISANNKTKPIEERGEIINRNKTDGKYGIWGHDIGDLDLSAIIVTKNLEGKILLELIVES